MASENGHGSLPLRRALVVDDSGAVRAVLREMLEEAGLSVVEAASGAESLSVLGLDGSIGLVFLDLNMPDMSGRAVLAGMRSHAQTAKLPVVMLSGEGRPADISELEQQGTLEWMQKPVRFDNLVKVARQFLLPD